MTGAIGMKGRGQGMAQISTNSTLKPFMNNALVMAMPFSFALHSFCFSCYTVGAKLFRLGRVTTWTGFLTFGVLGGRLSGSGIQWVGPSMNWLPLFP
jgi:hypothetical protein